MSNDIFYTNISNLVTFYMGERPSADKFNAVNKYFSRGIRELATAIGDINDDGFPYIGSGEGLGPSWNVYEASDGGKKNRPLDIVSLGRLIGPSSNLNSRMHLNHGQQSELIQEEIESGSSTFELLYPVENNQITVPGVSKVDEEVGFDGSQQYKVIRNRQLLFSSATTESKTVSYFTNPNNYYGGVDYQNSSFNVIPDPNQNEGVEITSLGHRKYRVTFPKITAQQSGLSSLKSSNISTENEFNNNKYYELPKWLIDSIVDTDGVIIEENKTIPGNFLYLKNRVTQEIYKDASYEYESPTSLLVSNLDICEDENGSYSNTDYCVILTGTNITNLLDDVRLKWFKHSHDGTFGESPIQFSSLVGKFKGVAPSGTYGPSSNEWNQMPMYLHRDGYVEDANSNNGNNAMRGNLALGLESFNPLNASSNIMEDTGSSHKVLFGGLATYIGRAGSTLEIINDTGSMYTYSSGGMHLKTEYNLLIETNGQSDQNLVLRNNKSNILLETSKNIKGTNLNGKEYLDIDVVEKEVTVNEGFVFEEFTPIELQGNYETSDLLKKKHLQKKGVEAKKIYDTLVSFTIDSNYQESLKIDESGSLIADSAFTVLLDSEALWGEKVYILEESDDSTVPAKWDWDASYLSSSNSSYNLIASGTPLMTQVYRDFHNPPENISGFLILSDPRSMNNSYEINLSAVLQSYKWVPSTEQGVPGSYEEDGLVDVLHLPESGQLNALTGSGHIDEYEPKYTLIELNRALSYERIEKKSEEEIKNTFYFKVNLPNVFNSVSLNKGYFPRFLIRFEYSGKLDGNEYFSNNPCITANNNAVFISPLLSISNVTLNGRVLDETTTAPMILHISGESDSYDTEWIKAGGRSKVGFNEGIKMYDETAPNGPTAYSETIKNEYTPGAFSTNQFKANTWYKVEERIFKGKVWLDITG